jgi:hypothetical protein
MKKIIGVAVVFGISVLIANVIVHAKDAQEYKIRREILGQEQLKVCDLKGQNCTTIQEKEKIPMRIEMPLGRHILTQESEILCLARNITREAQGNKKDMTLVGWGTVNRVKYGYGKTICAVISAKNQMTWYSNPVKRRMPPSKEAIAVAKGILAGQIPNPAPHCKITNWYNRILDKRNTTNEKCFMRNKACTFSHTGANHIYIGVPYGKC